MGCFKTAQSDGLRICRSDCAGSVDYQKVLEALCKQHQLALPDLEPFRRKGRQQVRVTVLENSDEGLEVSGHTLPGLNPAATDQSFYF